MSVNETDLTHSDQPTLNRKSDLICALVTCFDPTVATLHTATYINDAFAYQAATLDALTYAYVANVASHKRSRPDTCFLAFQRTYQTNAHHVQPRQSAWSTRQFAQTSSAAKRRLRTRTATAASTSEITWLRSKTKRIQRSTAASRLRWSTAYAPATSTSIRRGTRDAAAADQEPWRQCLRIWQFVRIIDLISTVELLIRVQGSCVSARLSSLTRRIRHLHQDKPQLRSLSTAYRRLPTRRDWLDGCATYMGRYSTRSARCCYGRTIRRFQPGRAVIPWKPGSRGWLCYKEEHRDPI